MGWTTRVRFPAGTEIFSLSTLFQGPTQPPIHWGPGAFSVGVQWPGHDVITHLNRMLSFTFISMYVLKQKAQL
jgi:hypothetical protein